MNEFSFDLVEFGDRASFHTTNAPGEEFRLVPVQTPQGSSPLNMTIKLVEVHHGSMIHQSHPSEATLLLFQLHFESRLQKRRYKSVCVTLEFFDKGKESRLDPEIVDLAPKRTHWLQKTTYDRTTRRGATLSATAGLEPANVEAAANWELEQRKPVNFKATVNGRSSLSRGKSGGENTVEWSMEENKSEQDGVPSFLQAAVLLRRESPRPFYARMRVESQVDAKSGSRRLFSCQTDEDKTIDHVTFTPGNTQLKSSAVTGIRDVELNQMERLNISQYAKASFSEPGALGGAGPYPAAEEPEHTASIEPEPVTQQDNTPPPAPVSGFPKAPTSSTTITPPDRKDTEDQIRKEAKTLAVESATRSPLAVAVDSVARAAESAAKAAEAAAKAAEAAARTAEAVAKVAEAASVKL